jgi:acyl-CoA synthetase (AMP-forming)/AMP-acid ligase II
MSQPFGTVAECLEFYARRTPDALLIRHADRSLTYLQAAERARQLAKSMLLHGVRRGDRVAVYAHPHAEVLIVFLAASSIGAIFVGLNPRQTSDEIGYVLATARPSHLFVIGSFDATHTTKLSGLGELLPPVRTVLGSTVLIDAGDYIDYLEGAVASDEVYESARAAIETADPVAMVFTSGSTGKPKGALLTNGPMMLSYAVQAKHWYPDGQPPQGVADLPIHHLGFIGDNCMAVLPAGGGVSILERWSPEGVLELIETNRITFWWTQTTLLQMATESPRWQGTDLSSLRIIGFAGAPVNERMLSQLLDTGIPLATSYGMTEVHGNCTYTDIDAEPDALRGTVGRPDPLFDVAVLGEDGARTECGVIGEIAVKGPSLCGGYWHAQGTITNVRDPDGWYHTKDLGIQLDDGNIKLVGRKDHMFKSGGYNVYPREIESVLEEHADVRSAIVLSVPDQKWGHVGRAFILRQRETVTDEDLREHTKARLANYKVPKYFVLCAEFPMLASGKVDRVALAEIATAASSVSSAGLSGA